MIVEDPAVVKPVAVKVPVPAQRMFTEIPFKTPLGKLLHVYVYRTQEPVKVPKFCSEIVVVAPKLSVEFAYANEAYRVVAFEIFCA